MKLQHTNLDRSQNLYCYLTSVKSALLYEQKWKSTKIYVYAVLRLSLFTYIVSLLTLNMTQMLVKFWKPTTLRCGKMNKLISK